MRIMVADDEPLVVMLVSEVLTEAGYEVVEADGSRDALTCLAKGLEIDALVTDINMPGHDGFEVARRARQAKSNLPLIFISGRNHYDAAEAFLPPRRYMQKPFSVHELVNMVADMLATKPDSSSSK